MKNLLCLLIAFLFFAVSTEKACAQTTSLVVTFTDSQGTHEMVNGETGSLKDLINNYAGGDRDFTKVTALKVESGQLNGADIATLRQMARGNNFLWIAQSSELAASAEENKTYQYYDYTVAPSEYKNPADWKQGSLKTLDLTNASFKHSDDVFLTDVKFSTQGSKEIENFSVNKDANCIPAYAFANCRGLEEVTLPRQCNGVNESVFFYCTNLKKVNFTGKLESVGGKAFKNCENLEQDFDLSDVTEGNLQEFAFANCYNIRKVKLNVNLKNIFGYVFSHCHNMTIDNFDALQSIETIGYRAFADCFQFDPGENGVYKFPNTVKSIAGQAFAHINVKEITLPENSDYREIAIQCFGWNSKNEGKYALTTVHIPANVTTIGSGAFTDCDELTGLDIDDNAKISTIRDNAFSDDASLTDADLNRLMRDITVVDNNTFGRCKGLHTIDFSKAVNGISELRDHAFSECTNVTSIIVNTAAAPATTTASLTKDNDPFAFIPANQVTITFSGDANGYDESGNTGYMSYRKNAAFMRLLTKHLDEDNTVYDVNGQMHADVILQRTFKAGYNTLALPFGAPYNTDRKTSCAQVYSNALFMGSESNGKISVYRGLKNNVFMFLKYSNTTTDPIDEFEPILVYMTQQDIDNAIVADGASNNVATDYLDLSKLENGKQYYKFENVDVNYDKNNNTLYTKDNLPGFVTSQGQQFTGAIYNQEMAWFKGATNDYAFIGSYVNSTETMHPGDYFIQTKADGNTYFYVVDAGNDKNGKPKKYRSKGFRGWFTPVNAGNASTAKSLSVKIFDEDGNSVITGIEAINSNDNAEKPADVYNLSGQLVSKSATSLGDLAKGIYIWKGKKVIVK